MAIPDYESLMLPLLHFSGDGQMRKISDACTNLCKQYGAAESDPVLVGRLGTAKLYLVEAKLLEVPTKASFQITPRGKNLLKSPPVKITRIFLQRYPEFVLYRGGKVAKAEKVSALPIPAPAIASGKAVALPAPPPATPSEPTSDEPLKYAYGQLQQSLTEALLNQIKQVSPKFFEKLVVDLLVAMGYGYNTKNAAKVVGGSGDGGVDGIIMEDPLGLDVIYVQAKKREGGFVGLTDIQKFSGALQGFQATKGVFLTSGKFADETKAFVKTLPCKIVLIDGEQLFRYMIDFNVGVSVRQVYQVKKIDMDYFAEE